MRCDEVRPSARVPQASEVAFFFFEMRIDFDESFVISDGATTSVAERRFSLRISARIFAVTPAAVAHPETAYRTPLGDTTSKYVRPIGGHSARPSTTNGAVRS